MLHKSRVGTANFTLLALHNAAVCSDALTSYPMGVVGNQRGLLSTSSAWFRPLQLNNNSINSYYTPTVYADVRAINVIRKWTSHVGNEVRHVFNVSETTAWVGPNLL